MLVVRRQEQVEAIQWTGESTAEVIGWLHTKTTVDEVEDKVVWFGGRSGKHLLEFEHGKENRFMLFQDDWLLLTEGRLHWMRNDKFSATYEAA